jgi:magnesium transporter
MIKNFYVEEVKNKESTEEFTSNEIMFSYNITSEEYQILSKKLNIKEQRLRDTINEEVFTPRMTKSDWEIYKIYYPKLNYEKDEDGNDIKSTMNAELIPLVVLYKDDQIVLLQEKYTQELEAFITSYLETQT